MMRSLNYTELSIVKRNIPFKNVYEEYCLFVNEKIKKENWPLLLLANPVFEKNGWPPKSYQNFKKSPVLRINTFKKEILGFLSSLLILTRLLRVKNTLKEVNKKNHLYLKDAQRIIFTPLSPASFNEGPNLYDSRTSKIERIFNENHFKYVYIPDLLLLKNFQQNFQKEKIYYLEAELSLSMIIKAFFLSLVSCTKVLILNFKLVALEERIFFSETMFNFIRDLLLKEVKFTQNNDLMFIVNWESKAHEKILVNGIRASVKAKVIGYYPAFPTFDMPILLTVESDYCERLYPDKIVVLADFIKNALIKRGIPNDKITVSGFYFQVPDKKIEKKKSGKIIVGLPLNKEKAEEFLSFARKHELQNRLIIKLHPFLEIGLEDFEATNKSILELREDHIFIITLGYSSLTLEAACAGMIPLIYSHRENCVCDPTDLIREQMVLRFSNLNDFKKLTSEFGEKVYIVEELNNLLARHRRLSENFTESIF